MGCRNEECRCLTTGQEADAVNLKPQVFYGGREFHGLVNLVLISLTGMVEHGRLRELKPGLAELSLGSSKLQIKVTTESSPERTEANGT